MNGTIEDGYVERRRKEVRRDKIEAEGVKVQSESRNTVKQDIGSVCARMKPLLFNGIPTLKIEEVLYIDPETYTQALEILIENREITREQIKMAREERARILEEFVYTCKKKGYSDEQIAKLYTFGSKSSVNDVTKKLKRKGILTKKDLELGEIEAKTRKFVLRGIKDGLTEEEIASKCKIKELAVEDVKSYIDELIELGEISKDAIILARQNKDANSNKGLSKQVEPYEKQIETLYRLGFSGQQITKITKLSDGYVRKIRNKLGITVEQSKEWQSRRKEMANKRKFDISAMVGFSKDIDIKTIQDQVAYLRAEKELHGVRPQDISTIGKVIPMEHRLLTLGNINFVIRCLSDLSKLEEAVSFINECLEAARTYEDTKNNGKLISMRELLERKIARQKEEQAKRGAKTHKSRREAWIASSVKATPQGEVKPRHEGDEALERADTRSVVDSEIAE